MWWLEAQLSGDLETTLEQRLLLIEPAMVCRAMLVPSWVGNSGEGGVMFGFALSQTIRPDSASEAD